MSLTRNAPNLILLTAKRADQTIDDVEFSEAATPGMLIEFAASGGELMAKKNSVAADIQYPFILLDQPHFNKGIDDAVAAGDRAPIYALRVGDVWNALIPSGQDIAVGDHLQSNGDGYLKEATATTAAANVAHFQSLDAPGAVTVATRLRVMRVA